MNKTKRINKIILAIAFAIALALSLVIISNATVVDTIELDSLFQYSSGSFTSYGGMTTAIVSDGYLIKEIDIFEYDNSKPYYKSYIISNIEAFQLEWNGYTYSDFNELMEDTFHYFGFQEYQYNYLMSWTPPISQEQYNELQQGFNTLQGEYNQLQLNYGNLEQNYQNLSNSIPTLEQNAKQEVWQEVDNINVNQYIYGFSSNGALLNNVDITNGATLTEFIATNYIAQRNIDLERIDVLSNANSTLLSELETLENSIPNIKAEAKNEGYNEGMRDGDAVERGVMSIVGAPMYILTSIFDVEIFGINLLNLITTIMTIILVAWVIKKLAN